MRCVELRRGEVGMEEGGGARRRAALQQQPPPIESFAYTGKGEGKGGKEVLIERVLRRRAEKKRAMRASLAERERAVAEAGSEPRILTSQDIRASSSSSYSPASDPVAIPVPVPVPVPSQPAKRKSQGKGGEEDEKEKVLIERVLRRRAEKKRAMRAALAERERAVLEAGSEPRILTSQDVRASSSLYSPVPVPSQPAKRNWEDMLANCSRKLQRIKVHEEAIKAQEEMIASLTDVGLQHPNKKRKKSTPSNFIRARLGDRYIIVSKWFPLPKGATHPEIIDQKEMDMIWKQRDKDWRRKLAQLSPAQRRSDAYKRVYHSMWKPPPSPFKLLQETHYSDPWRVLVICVLLNITTGRQVEKVLPRLFHLCPNAEVATKVPNKEIEEVIKSCGLYQKRADDIKKLSAEYLNSNWTHVTELHNVGKYAADAYAIFCVGKPEAVVPDDHKLVDYWRFVLEKKQAEELDQKRKERKRVEF